MAEKKPTVYQALTRWISGKGNSTAPAPIHINSYDMSNYGSKVIYRTTDKADYEQKKLELQQDKFLRERWRKANINLSVSAYAGLNAVQLMYRDADFMDSSPEIGAALDIMAEESTITNPTDGMVVNVYSKSERVKRILEDLFVNRLNLNITAQMVIRAMCKYGNQFMLLDIDHKNGVKGWRQLPVMHVERIENGVRSPYAMTAGSILADNNKDTATKFIWTDENSSAQEPFMDWQVAHFRLISNSLYLPYGVSALNAARRHWHMLSLMEDMMLIYRLERSIERRVYKIFVGAIDDADVGAYVEQIANEFKRTPIVDPATGQIDLRKNILPVHKDTPIPLLDGRTISIEELAKEYQEGKENFVYSVQDKTLQIVPGKVAWCGKNYTAEKLVKITLDDDTYMVMAPEHEVIMRDGSKKRADELVDGESIMPFVKDKEHISEIEKSNKVKSIEWVSGDDVYCMTVVGPNNEDDRHNFALKTWTSDGSICDNGCFVSNCVDNDLFVPVRDESAPSPVETLSAGQNMTALDDIKYVQNKICTALRIPKSFLNFEDAKGDGQNLAMLDIRFTRTVNRIQQAFIMELSKIAAVHLFLLGFNDEMTNFTLSMNNPSTQAEQLEIENLQKKVAALRDAVSDPGNGIPALSWTRALKLFLKMSEKDIAENLEEIRLEKAISAELEKTTQIIKKTGLFNSVDRIYGEPGAQYQDEQQGAGGEEGGDMGGGGGPMGGGGPTDFGSELDGLGAPGEEDGGGDIAGNEGAMPTGDMGGDDMPPGDMPVESYLKKSNLLTESFIQDLNAFKSKRKRMNETKFSRVTPYDSDSLLINEEFDKMMSTLNQYLSEQKELDDSNEEYL